MFARFRGKDISAKPAESEAAGLSELRAGLATRVDLALSEKEQAWASDACLLRFLRARSLIVPKALDMLVACLEWRRSYGVEELKRPGGEHEAVMRETAACGKMFVLDHCDNLGRAVIVMRPGFEDCSDGVKNVRFLVYTLERAADLAHSGHFTILIDYFSGKISLRNSPSLAIMKETVHILQNMYPERLGDAFLFDAPRFFLTTYKIVSALMDPVTRDKVNFVAKGQPVAVLDPGTTPVEYGGSLDYTFNVGKYIPSQ